MTRYTPLYMQAKVGDTAVEYDGLTMRWGLTGIWASEGVTNNGFRITQRAAGANFSVDIAPGIAVITGNDVSSQGTYQITSDAIENVVIPDPPASGEDIWDIVLHVKDALYDGTLPDDTYEWDLEVLEDDGFGTPVGMPDTAILLGQVAVAAAQTSVTDGDINNFQISALTAPSWLQQVASDAGRPPVPLNGERIWRTDRLDMEVYDGSTWRQSGLNPPYAILRRSSNVAIATATTTALGFDLETADSHGGHDNVTNNTRYTIPQSGVWEASGVVPWANSIADGKYEMGFRVNGGTTWAAGSTYKGTDNVTPILHGSAKLLLNQGDYVEMMIWQGTGGSQTVDAAFNQGPRFEIEWRRSL